MASPLAVGGRLYVGGRLRPHDHCGESEERKGENGGDSHPARQAETAEERAALAVVRLDGCNETVGEIRRKGVMQQSGVVHGAEPAGVFGLFGRVEFPAIAAPLEMKVESALRATGQTSVQRILEKIPGLLAIHSFSSSMLDDASGRIVRTIFARMRLFASCRRDFTVPSGTERTLAISGTVKSSK